MSYKYDFLSGHRQSGFITREKNRVFSRCNISKNKVFKVTLHELKFRFFLELNNYSKKFIREKNRFFLDVTQAKIRFLKSHYAS